MSTMKAVNTYADCGGSLLLKRQDVPFVDLWAQHAPLAAEIEEALAAVLRRSDFVLGSAVSLLEEEFATYCGASHAIGVSSGTAALELALLAYGIGQGDEVIIPANTFIATAFAITHAGAIPILTDIDPHTYAIDVAAVEKALTGRTRAIVPVHLYGHPVDMDPLLEIARDRGLVVIEDACQAHGAKYKGRRVGALGQAAAFSFYPSKNLGACGDGGMVVTDDAEIADRIRVLRNQGQRAKYTHVARGYNHRLDTLQAAVLRIKLRYLDDWNAARRRHARLYTEALSAASTVVCPREASYAEPVYHLYVVRTSHRDELQGFLRELGIATGIHYPIPIHLQPAYSDLGYGIGDFPTVEAQAGQLLSLPMYPELTPEQCVYVSAGISAFEQLRSPEPVLADDQPTAVQYHPGQGMGHLTPVGQDRESGS